MHPWDFYGFRVRVEHARCKRANNISTNLECLMDRWRLMNRACDRLEILRVERERIEIAVPADRVEWMMGQRHTGESRSILDENIDVFLLIDRNYFARTMKIALRVGGTHLNLPLVIQVTLRNPDRPDRFENKVILLLNVVRNQPVGDSAWNDDVILGAIRQVAENRFHHAAAAKHKNDLIGAAVFIILKLVVRLRRLGAVRDHVLIKQHRNTSGVEIAASRDVGGF